MGTTWQVSTNGSTWSSFATAGIEKASLMFRANGIDEFRFRVVQPDWTTDPTYTSGSTIYVATYDTVTTTRTVRFIGTLRQSPRQATANNESVDYRFFGPFWYFEQITYQQQWQIYSGGLSNINKARVVLGQSNAGAQQSAGSEIGAVVDYLIARGIGILKGTIDTGPTLPYSEHTNLRCADAIRQCLRYTPDVVWWFDYTTQSAGVYKPTIHCRAVTNLTAAAIAIHQTDTERCALVPRYDLQKPGIRIVYEMVSSYDGTDYNSYSVDTAGDTADVLSVDLSFELAGSITTFLKQEIDTDNYPASPYTDKTWWRSHIPWLKDIADGDLVISDVSRDGSGSYTKYLVKGSVQDWMTGKSVEYETWTAKIAYIRKDISGNVQEKVEKKTVTIKLASTNCSTQTYRVVASYTSSEAVPTGVAAAVYASWSKLHWDGELLITEAEATFSALPKHKVNLTGGRTEWASMDAIVQESIIDIDSGQTTIKVGSSGRLEADSLVALYRAAHARRYSYSRLSRTNATISGPESTGSYNMPTSHLSEGDPGERMRLRVADTDGSRTHILDLNPSGVTFADGDDAAAKTLQLREIKSIEIDDGDLVYRLRQVLCSEPYHDAVLIKTTPDGTATGQILHWNNTTGAWTVSTVGTLADGDMLKWDGTKWVKITPTEVTVLTAHQYSTSSHKLQVKSRTIKAIEPGSESSWTDVTGGDAVNHGDL